MSQLQALQELYVGGNQLRYSDVEFIIESFLQLTSLGIDSLGLTGRFSPFAKVAPVRLLISAVCAALPDSIANLQNLTTLIAHSNALQGN
jgi:Leucine-rich repeat (LRR) protein